MNPQELANLGKHVEKLICQIVPETIILSNGSPANGA